MKMFSNVPSSALFREACLTASGRGKACARRVRCLPACFDIAFMGDRNHENAVARSNAGNFIKTIENTMFIILFFFLFSITGCGEGDPELEPATLISIVPEEGSSILSGSIVILTFDKDPGVVTSNSIVLDGNENVRTIKIESSVIEVAWEDGQKRLLFELIPVEREPPRLVRSFPQNAATEINSEELIKRGIILEFTDRILSIGQIWVNEIEVEWEYTIEDAKITIWPDPSFHFEPGMNVFLIVEEIVGPRLDKSEAGIGFQIKE